MAEDRIEQALKDLCIYQTLAQMQNTESFETLYGEYFQGLGEKIAEDFNTFMNASKEDVEKAYLTIKEDMESAIDEERTGDNDPEEIQFYQSHIDALEILKQTKESKDAFEQFSEEDLAILEKAGRSREEIKRDPNKAKELLAKLKQEDREASGTDSEADSAEDKSGMKENTHTSQEEKETNANTLRVTEEKDEKSADHREKGWIEKKQEWFGRIKDTLDDYKSIYPDAEKSNEFMVGFNGGTVHYTTPDDAMVSEEAEFKIYDVLLQDPDNKDKVIEFPEDASEHLTTMLFAAAVLNKTSGSKAHQMVNLDQNKINWDVLRNTLNKEQYAELEAYIKCQEALARLNKRELGKQEATAEAYIKRVQQYNKDQNKDIKVSFEKIIANSAIASNGRS